MYFVIASKQKAPLQKTKRISSKLFAYIIGGAASAGLIGSMMMMTGGGAAAVGGGGAAAQPRDEEGDVDVEDMKKRASSVLRRYEMLSFLQNQFEPGNQFSLQKMETVLEQLVPKAITKVRTLQDLLENEYPTLSDHPTATELRHLPEEIQFKIALQFEASLRNVHDSILKTVTSEIAEDLFELRSSLQKGSIGLSRLTQKLEKHLKDNLSKSIQFRKITDQYRQSLQAQHPGREIHDVEICILSLTVFSTGDSHTNRWNAYHPFYNDEAFSKMVRNSLVKEEDTKLTATPQPPSRNVLWKYFYPEKLRSSEEMDEGSKAEP